VPIDVTPSRHCQALPLSSSHRIDASLTHPSLGGEAPTPSTAVGVVLGAGASLETVAITVRSSRLHVVDFPLTVFAATSE
jgi:hypothetical protein